MLDMPETEAEAIKQLMVLIQRDLRGTNHCTQ